MLVHLSVRNVVLIDQLDLELGSGLCVFTGETGAGKSVLLDALGLVLGRRADTGLIQKGSDKAMVTATFALVPGHPIVPLLEQIGLEATTEVVVRRTINAEGRSRAFVNDHPVTVSYLSQIGSFLVEIHGQNDRLGLLDQGVHRDVLDLAGGHHDICLAVASAYREWMVANEEVSVSKEIARTTEIRESMLQERLSELENVSPEVGEEKKLSEMRSLLKESVSIAEAIAKVRLLLGDSDTDAIDSRIGAAHRIIDGIAGAAGGHLDGLLQSLDRVSIELQETLDLVEEIGVKLDADPQQLSEVEERLFMLRSMASKHGVSIDELKKIQDELSAELKIISSGGKEVERKEKIALEKQSVLSKLIAELHLVRKKTGREVDVGVAREMETLRMEGVKFHTVIRSLPSDEWTENGGDRITFEVSTVPGAEMGPIHKVASGGELSRFMLALRVVIAGAAQVKTLVFDEIDAGIGGAVADSVGQRLARLAGKMQVLVVTHQPQIAVQAGQHYRVAKKLDAGGAATHIEQLGLEGCIEEIARMLAGEEISNEARAAAKRLLAEAL